MSTPTQTEIAAKNHHRAVRFFWGFLIGATTVSLIGNITHAVLPYIPRIAIQIGAAAVPPIALHVAVGRKVRRPGVVSESSRIRRKSHGSGACRVATARPSVIAETTRRFP